MKLTIEDDQGVCVRRTEISVVSPVMDAVEGEDYKFHIEIRLKNTQNTVSLYYHSKDDADTEYDLLKKQLEDGLI